MNQIEEFSEKFDVLSMSTMSVRDFPLKNKILDDNKGYSGNLIPFESDHFNLLYDFGLNDN